jgi:hypothetical protein
MGTGAEMTLRCSPARAKNRDVLEIRGHALDAKVRGRDRARPTT